VIICETYRDFRYGLKTISCFYHDIIPYTIPINPSDRSKDMAMPFLLSLCIYALLSRIIFNLSKLWALKWLSSQEQNLKGTYIPTRLVVHKVLQSTHTSQMCHFELKVCVHLPKNTLERSQDQNKFHLTLTQMWTWRVVSNRQMRRSTLTWSNYRSDTFPHKPKLDRDSVEVAAESGEVEKWGPQIGSERTATANPMSVKAITSVSVNPNRPTPRFSPLWSDRACW